MQARLDLFIQLTTPTLTKSVRRFLNPTDKGFLSVEGILIFTTTGSIDSTPPPPHKHRVTYIQIENFAFEYTPPPFVHRRIVT